MYVCAKHIQLSAKQTNIYDRLYNNNSDNVRDSKSYFTSVESNENQ